MSEKNRIGNRELADRLRGEASANRPEFSASLHARLCRISRLCTGRTECPPDTPREVLTAAAARHQRPRHGATAGRVARWAVAVVAASCLLAAVALAWRASVPPAAERDEVAANVPAVAPEVPRPFPPEPAPVVAAIDPLAELEGMSEVADRAVEQLSDFIDSIVVVQQWAYLDHDARLAVQGLAGYLPFDVPQAISPVDGEASRPEGR
jgi:hypothetical protein